jgi:membrane protein
MSRPTGSHSHAADNGGTATTEARFHGNTVEEADGGDTAPGDDNITGRRADYAPTGADSRTGFFPTAKRTLKEFSEDNMTDWAASLTYYGVLALFPALLAVLSIVGLVTDP